MKLMKCLAVLLSLTTVFSCALTSMAEVAVVEEVAAKKVDFEVIDLAETATIDLQGVEAQVVEVEEVVEEASGDDSVRENLASEAPLLGFSGSGTESSPWLIGSPNAEDVKAWLSSDKKTLTITGTGAMMDFSDSQQPWVSEKNGITSVSIGSGITKIGQYAFQWFGSLASVDIPSGVEIIGYGAFIHCANLASVTIPDSVKNIGDYSFQYCMFSSLTIPGNVTYIGYSVFSFNSNLENVWIKAVNPPTSPLTIFWSCGKLNKIYVPKASVSAYKSASMWSTYEGKIEGYYCTVAYEANGATSGNVPTDSILYLSSNTVTVLGNTGNLEREGCEFSGWNTEADGTGTSYQATDTFTISDYVILYAQWVHTHSFTYTAEKNVLKATCKSGCLDGYDKTPLTLTMTAPEDIVYDGNPKEITFADMEYVSWTDAGLADPIIGYAPVENLTDGKPVNKGNYTAAVYMSGNDATARLDMRITGKICTITVNSGAGGTVSSGKSSAEEGDTITLSVTPDAGYQLKSLTVKDVDAGAVTVTDNKFTMPGKAVIVTAEFEKIPSEQYNIDYSGENIRFMNSDGGQAPMSANAGDFVVFRAEAASGITYDQIDVTVFETESKKEIEVITMATAADVAYRFTMPAASVTVKAETELIGHMLTLKVSEGIKGLFLQLGGDEEPIYFTAEECSEPVSMPEGMKLILIKVDCKDAYECSMSLPYTFTMPDHDDTLTITAKKKSNPSPIRHDEENDNTPLFTGTWNNAVANGIWTQDSNGIWHYTSTEKFKATWGYILNPYAGEGQNKADWFWFDVNGNMLTGWQYINGKWYYLNPTKNGTLGACLIGPAMTPDGYEVDASGAWTGR